jgi:hypothetical protein
MIPLKNIKSNWLIYYLIIIPITYEVVKHMFDPTITLGDVIVLCVTVPTLIVGVWKSFDFILYRKYPFDMRFQESLHYEYKPILSKRAYIKTGIQTLLLRIKPKRLADFEEIHIRLVDEKGWFHVPFPVREKLSVNHLQIEGLLGNISTWDKEDHTNGMHGSFVNSDGTRTSYKIAPEEALILTIAIKSDITWSGYLAVKLLREDGHIGYSYLKLEIKEMEFVDG